MAKKYRILDDMTRDELLVTCNDIEDDVDDAIYLLNQIAERAMIFPKDTLNTLSCGIAAVMKFKNKAHHHMLNDFKLDKKDIKSLNSASDTQVKKQINVIFKTIATSIFEMIYDDPELRNYSMALTMNPKGKTVPKLIPRTKNKNHFFNIINISDMIDTDGGLSVFIDTVKASNGNDDSDAYAFLVQLKALYKDISADNYKVGVV